MPESLVLVLLQAAGAKFDPGEITNIIVPNNSDQQEKEANLSCWLFNNLELEWLAIAKVNSYSCVFGMLCSQI